LFDRDFIEKIKLTVKTSEVVGKTVKLKRRGREFVGLSPFKVEKTPSFTVSDEKGFYHCFSSGKHGDIINFVMETENADFTSAVRKICLDFGIEEEFSSEEDFKAYKNQTSMMDCLKSAHEFFKESLFAESSGSLEARSHLISRGMKVNDVGKFGIGYSDSNKKSLCLHLNSLGFDDEIITACGLSMPKIDQLPIIDKFTSRIMFPIKNRYGQVVAFGGRKVSGDGAKYINSPETAVFKKRETLYNIENVLKSYKHGNNVLFVEGYMDVISLHQSGIVNALSPMGTALTIDQLTKVWDFCPNPIVCFDGDEAGKRSAIRFLKSCLPDVKPENTFSFVFLEDGMDPEDFINKKGANELKRLISSPVSICEAVWMFEKELLKPINTPEKRSLLRQNCLSAVSKVKHKDLGFGFRSEIIKMFSSEFPQSYSKSSKRGYVDDRCEVSSVDGNNIESLLMGCVFFFPDIFKGIKDMLKGIECQTPECKEIRSALSSINEDASALDVEKEMLFNLSPECIKYFMRNKNKIIQSFGSGELQSDDVSEIWKFNLKKLIEVRASG